MGGYLKTEEDLFKEGKKKKKCKTKWEVINKTEFFREGIKNAHNRDKAN